MCIFFFLASLAHGGEKVLLNKVPKLHGQCDNQDSWANSALSLTLF